MGQTTPADQDILRNINKRGEKSDLGCFEYLFVSGDRQEKTRYLMPALHFSTNTGGQFVREKAHSIYGC